MRVSIAAFLMFLTLAISGEAADFQDDKQASVSQAWTETVVIKGTDYTIETANYKYAIDTIYSGQHREIIPARKELFRRWAKSLRHPEEYAQLCDHEIQIHDGKQEYWIPLQNALLNPFAAEAKPNSRLRLHIMYIGATGNERVFMITRFQAL